MNMDLPSGTINVSYTQDMAIVRTRLRWILLLLFLAALFTLPLFLSGYGLRLVSTIAIVTIVVHGLNIVFGYCGQVSLGQAALMAVGGYTSAILVTKLGFSFWISLPIAGLLCALAGMVFGLPSLRIKGMYLAVVTLAAHFIIMYAIAIAASNITGGNMGISAPRPRLGIIDFKSDKNYYYIVMIIAVLMTFFTKNLARTATGRAFMSIRDNAIAAEVMGVNLLHYKFLAFSICSFYAGIAGALLAHLNRGLHPDYFTLMDSIWYLAMVMIGGAGRTTGSIFGVIFLVLLDRLATFVGPILAKAFPAISAGVGSALGPILFGAAIVLFITFEPRGLAHRLELFKSKYRRWPFPYWP